MEWAEGIISIVPPTASFWMAVLLSESLEPSPKHSCQGVKQKLQEQCLALPIRETSLWIKTYAAGSRVFFLAWLFFLVVFNSFPNVKLKNVVIWILQSHKMRWHTAKQKKNLFWVTEFLGHITCFGFVPDVHLACISDEAEQFVLPSYHSPLPVHCQYFLPACLCVMTCWSPNIWITVQ